MAPDATPPRWRAATAILALALGVAGQSPAQEPAAPGVLPPVRLMEVTTPDNDISRQFYGRVVARQTVDMAFQVGGKPVGLLVLKSQTVTRGDLLAQLDLPHSSAPWSGPN
jgi:multidrug efflux pump subunit AcrA (membrane-fusion protein)